MKVDKVIEADEIAQVIGEEARSDFTQGADSPNRVAQRLTRWNENRAVFVQVQNRPEVCG
jgi:hypothetical protein